MSSADCLAAVSRRDGQEMLATLPPTPWDPSLYAAMAQAGHPVYEEELRTELLRAMVEVRKR